MFRLIPDILTAAELGQLRAIAAKASFVDGRISAKGSPVKNNLRIGDMDALQQSSQLLGAALYRNEDFRACAFPRVVAPPLLTLYGTGMHYGIHADAAFMPVGGRTLRSDVSCTIFISDENDYEGGALCIHLGSQDLRIRGKAGSAIVYPSTTLHEVEPVTAGQRLVGLTFIESRIVDAEQREWLFELNDIINKSGERMDIEPYTRLQRVRENLLRYWAEPD